MSAVTCGYCGRSFAADQGQPACASCPLRGGCRYLRCPHCGYENPTSPAWLTRLRTMFAPAVTEVPDAPITQAGKEALRP